MVDVQVADDWFNWMKMHHIPEVMNSGYFVSHRLCKLIQPESEQGSVTYAVQYFCSNLDKLQEYLTQAAPGLRDKHHERFGNKAQTFRTVLEIISDNPALSGDCLG